MISQRFDERNVLLVKKGVKSPKKAFFKATFVVKVEKELLYRVFNTIWLGTVSGSEEAHMPPPPPQRSSAEKRGGGAPHTHS